MPLELKNINGNGSFTLVNTSNGGGFSLVVTGSNPSPSFLSSVSITPTKTPTISVTPTTTPTLSLSLTPTPTPTISRTGVYTFGFDGEIGTSNFNVACAAFPIGSNSFCYSYNPTIQVGTKLYSVNVNGVLYYPFISTGNIDIVMDGTSIYAVKTNSSGIITELQQCYPTTLFVGQTGLGGKIAYILQSGDTGYDANVQHGLVANISLLNGVTRQWGCSTEVTGADATGLFTGYQNTLDIVAACADFGDSAAHDCANLVQYGFYDWYLPSKDELNKLYLNNAALMGPNNIVLWSSTEHSSNSGWVQNFADGIAYNDPKNRSNYVWPVRRF
jgi:hypothetical protein